VTTNLVFLESKGITYSPQNGEEDTIPPNKVELVSPTSGEVFTTGTVDILRAASEDTGGISGYMIQASLSPSFDSILMSGSILTTGVFQTKLPNNTYYRRVYAFDTAGNTGERSDTWNFVVNITIPESIPTVGTGYISAGTTGTD